MTFALEHFFPDLVLRGVFRTFPIKFKGYRREMQYSSILFPYLLSSCTIFKQSTTSS